MSDTKRCNRCETHKPRADFIKDGAEYVTCATCREKKRRQMANSTFRFIDGVRMKQCTECGAFFPPEEYYLRDHVYSKVCAQCRMLSSDVLHKPLVDIVFQGLNFDGYSAFDPIACPFKTPTWVAG